MEYKELYQLQNGAAPEEGVVFYTDQKLMRDLTLAESYQLSLDYNADPRTFEETVRFRNKYIDELEMLEISLAGLLNVQTEYRKRQKSYELLNDWVTPPKDLKELVEQIKNQKQKPISPDETITVALRAAGVHVLHGKDHLITEQTKFIRAGEYFCSIMMNYYSNRLPDRDKIRIDGEIYSFSHGALTFDKEEKGRKRVIFFVYDDITVIHSPFLKFVRENYTKANAEAGKLKPNQQHAGIAKLDDWHRLLQGLNLMALF